MEMMDRAQLAGFSRMRATWQASQLDQLGPLQQAQRIWAPHLHQVCVQPNWWPSFVRANGINESRMIDAPARTEGPPSGRNRDRPQRQQLTFVRFLALALALGYAFR